MRAIVYESFGGELTLQTVADPVPPADGVVVQVSANGICRSDWHGWQGHDGDIQTLPHVPGHELVGEVVAVGAEVRRYSAGDRVTVPFCMGCGTCAPCQRGDQQVCDQYHQPGFTGWGAFAEYVALPYADVNLVRVPPALDDVAVAALGCRFTTAFRAVIAQGRLRAGEWLAVYGCGGVGLSAVMIGAAMGARVIAVDINPAALDLARAVGAQHTLNATVQADVSTAIIDLTSGGAHVSIDALGSAALCRDSILSLGKRGRHVQVGLLTGADADPALPMGAVISKELEIYGSHGMQAHAYPDLLALIETGVLDPARLVTERVSLAGAAGVLHRMTDFATTGIVVIDKF